MRSLQDDGRPTSKGLEVVLDALAKRIPRRNRSGLRSCWIYDTCRRLEDSKNRERIAPASAKSRFLASRSK